MRTFSAAEQARWNSRGGVRHLIRVFVKDSGGTYRDLTTYAQAIVGGLNFLTSGTWKDAVDAPGQTGSFTCKREVGKLSLNPLITASALNKGLDPSGSYAPLLDVGRQVKVDRAIVADDRDPQSSDWVPAFQGYVDQVKIAETNDSITIVCSDNIAPLRDTFIEYERIYSYATGSSAITGPCVNGLRVWQPGIVVPGSFGKDTVVVPSEANATGYWYDNGDGNADTTAATEPIWPTTPGAEVTDGLSSSLQWECAAPISPTATTAAETVMQYVMNDNLTTPPTLRTDVSPSFLLRWFLQQRQSVLEALQAIVNCFAWDLRYRYHDDTTSWQLTLSAPNRTPGSADFTFTDPLGSGSSGSEGYAWTQLDVDISGIRNAIRVIISDASILDAAGNPTRVVCEAEDSTSITKYGRRFMEVSEGSVTGVNTTAQGTALAGNILSDLKNPKADAAWQCPFFPWVEIGDYYSWDPDGLLFDTAFSSGVVGYEHTIDGSKGRTVITLRGVPSSGYEKWLAKQAYVQSQTQPDVHRTTKFGPGQVAITTNKNVGGQEIQIMPFAQIQGQAVPPNYEIHVSKTNGFTPSLSTLKQAGQQLHWSTAQLIPGQTYYVIAIPYGYNEGKRVRGQPSQQFSFVAGQASALHIDSIIDLTRLPLNGSFETRLDTSGMPDHWTATNGAVGTNVVVVEDTNGVSGGRYMKLDTGASPSTASFDSDQFTVDPLIQSRLLFWRKMHAGSGNNFAVNLKWYTYLGNLISSAQSVFSLTDNVDTWIQSEVLFQPPSAARFLSVGFQLLSGASRTAYVAAVQIESIGKQWWTIGGGGTTEDGAAVPGFGDSWASSSGYATVAMRRSRDGEVQLRGTASRSVSGIGSGNPILTLPAGWRPPATVNFGTTANGKFGQLKVDSAGLVYLAAGDAGSPQTEVGLDVVRFRTWS
jgi:hypothetical protein